MHQGNHCTTFAGRATSGFAESFPIDLCIQAPENGQVHGALLATATCAPAWPADGCPGLQIERKIPCFFGLFHSGAQGSQHGKNSLNRVLTPGSRCCLKGSRSGHTVLRRPSGHEPIETLGFHAGLSGRGPCCLGKTGTKPPDGFLFSILLFDN